MSEGKSSGFSIEIKSKKHVKDISISSGQREAVLIEGDLGPLKNVSFFEDKALIVVERYGTLRLELSPTALCSAIRRANACEPA
jgi:hypothetical protein